MKTAPGLYICLCWNIAYKAEVYDSDFVKSELTSNLEDYILKPIISDCKEMLFPNGYCECDQELHILDNPVFFLQLIPILKSIIIIVSVMS